MNSFQSGVAKAEQEIMNKASAVGMKLNGSWKPDTSKLKKYTFKNGAVVIAETLEQAYEIIKRDFGIYTPVIKAEAYYGT